MEKPKGKIANLQSTRGPVTRFPLEKNRLHKGQHKDKTWPLHTGDEHLERYITPEVLNRLGKHVTGWVMLYKLKGDAWISGEGQRLI